MFGGWWWWEALAVWILEWRESLKGVGHRFACLEGKKFLQVEKRTILFDSFCIQIKKFPEI